MLKGKKNRIISKEGKLFKFVPLKKGMSENMKRRYKIYLIIFIIQFVFLFFNNSYAGISLTLEEFMTKYKTENMTSGKLQQKALDSLELPNDDKTYLREQNKKTIMKNCSAAIETAKGYETFEEIMKYLEDRFLNEAENGFKSDTAQNCLYWGYMFADVWNSCKENLEYFKKGEEEGLTVEELFDKKYEEYKNYMKEDGKKDAGTLDKYHTVLDKLFKLLPEGDEKDKRQKQLDEVDTDANDADKSVLEDPDTIYQYPTKNDSTSAGSLDDMIGDADKFIDSANKAAISSSSLQDFSKTFYNILLTIGIVVSALVGSILGIRFMIGGAEEKAHIKELLIPYIVGCIVVFGAFAIWKIVVTILSSTVS